MFRCGDGQIHLIEHDPIQLIRHIQLSQISSKSAVRCLICGHQHQQTAVDVIRAPLPHPLWDPYRYTVEACQPLTLSIKLTPQLCGINRCTQSVYDCGPRNGHSNPISSTGHASPPSSGRLSPVLRFFSYPYLHLTVNVGISCLLQPFSIPLLAVHLCLLWTLTGPHRQAGSKILALGSKRTSLKSRYSDKIAKYDEGRPTS